MLFVQIDSIANMATSTKESLPEDIKTQEGAALRKLLDDLKFNHQRLAKESEIGTKAYVPQLVNGRRPLNIEAAVRIANVLKVRIDDFSPRLAEIVRGAYEHVYPAPLQARMVSEPSPLWRGREFEPNRSDKSPGKWPFPRLTPDQYSMISEGGRDELEQLARGMYIEAHRSAKVSGG